MKSKVLSVLLALHLGGASALLAADQVFSGPQKGEKATPFKVVELTGEGAGKERDPMADAAGRPVALVFLHGVERSLVPLLRVTDEYGSMRKDRLNTEIVFLSQDRLAGEERGKAVAGSLKLQGRVGISTDGAEGPGNYGLNKECLMTIVIAKDNAVTSNFALVQPGIADAPKVIAALAEACGDTEPPTAEQLNQRQTARNGGGRERGMMQRGERPQTDFSAFDLNTEAGLRDAVKALIGEVTSLRAEVAELRRQAAEREKPRMMPAKETARDPLPGAAPTDGELVGLLRRFIRPTNDDATVDKVLGEVETLIKDNADLKRQAIDGWVRVLHLKYGTEYAQKTGREFVAKLQGESR